MQKKLIGALIALSVSANAFALNDRCFNSAERKQTLGHGMIITSFLSTSAGLTVDYMMFAGKQLHPKVTKISKMSPFSPIGLGLIGAAFLGGILRSQGKLQFNKCVKQELIRFEKPR